MTVHSSITTGRANEASDEKLLKRRAVLAGLTCSTVSFTLSTSEVVADDAGGFRKKPQNYSVLSLPFVRDTTAHERTAGTPPRCFWHVAPTGDYGADCGTGARYAALALDYMAAMNTPQILQWAVFDMMALQRPRSGIEVGFLSAFGQISTRAHATHLREGGLA